MLYPDYSNPQVLFSGPDGNGYNGYDMSGIIPNNGVIFVYMSSFSTFLINGHYAVKHYFLLNNVYERPYSYIGIIIPVKKGDNWYWVQGYNSEYHKAYLSKIVFYPYRR